MKYSFKEKQNHFQALRAAQHAVADLALLEQKVPALPQLRKFKLLPVRYADEILYALLDVCPREQIVSHRREAAAEQEKAAETAAKEERLKYIQELIDEAAEEEGLSPEDKEKVQSIVDEILSTSVGTADTIVGIIADAICKVTTVIPANPESTPAPEPDPEATAETIVSQALAESAAEEEAAAEQATEAKQELEELQESHEELQTAHEELQAEHEDLETQMQELEETNEQLQEELEEEKKKEPAKAKAAPKQRKKSTPK